MVFKGTLKTMGSFWKANKCYFVPSIQMDINIDLGEGGQEDKALLQYVSSCNIACGGHAGDPDSVRQTLIWAQQAGVAVGAHPSYPDRKYFGRRRLQIAANDLEAALLEQLELFRLCLSTLEMPWHHIKPHGALYNDLVTDRDMGVSFIRVLRALDFRGVVYALAGSPWVIQLQRAGFTVWEEGFVDRRYTDSGQLLSRQEQHAVLTDAADVLQQAENLHKGQVVTTSGKTMALTCQTLCLHSDTPNALSHARLLAHNFQL